MNRITNEQREAIVRKAVAERDALLAAPPTMPDDYWLHVRGCDCAYCTWERENGGDPLTRASLEWNASAAGPAMADDATLLSLAYQLTNQVKRECGLKNGNLVYRALRKMADAAAGREIHGEQP